MGTLLEVWGGAGGGEGEGEASLCGCRREGTLSLSLSAYLPSGFEGSCRSGERMDTSSSSRSLINTGFLFDGRTDNSQKAKSKKLFLSTKQFPDLENRFSSRVSQVIERGEGNRLIGQDEICREGEGERVRGMLCR